LNPSNCFKRSLFDKYPWNEGSFPSVDIFDSLTGWELIFVSGLEDKPFIRNNEQTISREIEPTDVLLL
jgi:hypothetical protein